jgi:signal transduction histidine kinase
LQPVLAAVFAPFTLALVALGVAALVNAFWRLKKATGDEREQLRWFAFSTAVFPVIMLVNGFAMGKSWQGYVLVAGFTVGLAAIAGGIGVAVIKYRLYAIDIVINKTVIFGAMAAFVTFVYVAVVAGIGSVLRSSGDSNLPLSLAATAIVAVAFQPIRARVTAVANRLVYGQRLSPYEAVASIARRVSESFSPQDVLPEMAEAAARSVGATRSRVRLFLPTGDERTFWWPDGSEDNPDVQFDRVLPVVHHGEHIGEVAVAKGRGEQITKHDEVLLADVTTEAALAMRSLRLTDELEERLIELQESRRRIVSAQDEERRRMERDIHDGAQQQLIAIKIKIALAKALVHDDLAAGCALLDDIAQESSEAIETLRDLARGLFPDILVDRGLVAAVQRHVTKSGIDAEVVAADGESRFDLETEANVYFVIREALQNAGKYAPTAKLRIDVSAVNGSLDFKVSDDGPGFDPLLAKLGRGSQNMRDRLEALGGTLHVVSAPGAGTQILGSVPRRDPSDEC